MRSWENYSWLWHSLRESSYGPWVDPILTVVALLCGIFVGGERQRREKPAGLRTLALVCLGSAIFTMASFAFTTTTGDSGRVAAQIVTGIGFLGAGVILHGQRIVSGVTTAAVIWVAAAIGMVVGSGYVIAGLALSLLGQPLHGPQPRSMKGAGILISTNVCFSVEFAPNGGLTRIRLERVLVEYEPGRLRVRVDRSLGQYHPAHAHTLNSHASISTSSWLSLPMSPDVRSIVRERCEPVKANASTSS